MNKKYVAIFALFICFSCVGCAVRTLKDITEKRTRGDTIVVYFDHNWENVYDAVKYVIPHSSVYPIAKRHKIIFYCIDYEKDQKTIFIYFSKYDVRDSVDKVIYFEPISKTKTKVEIVDGSYTAGESFIRYLIDETKFYLSRDKMDYDTFREYSIKNKEKYNQELLEKIFKEK